MRDKPCCLSFEVGDPCHCECRGKIARLSQENAALIQVMNEAHRLLTAEATALGSRSEEKYMAAVLLASKLAAQPSQSGEEK